MNDEKFDIILTFLFWITILLTIKLIRYIGGIIYVRYGL